MKVTQAALNEYRKQVDSQAEKARKYVSRALSAYLLKYPDASAEDVREFALDLFATALPNFTDLEATLSCDLFDELADACGFEGGRARIYDTTDFRQVAKKVSYLTSFVADGDAERFKREAADLTRYYCKRAAFDNMVENCRAQKVKWARMPTGFETCPFCFMLSSRGFVYASEAKAYGHGYHDNCDCVAVPGFQDEKGNPRVRIDGYDPQAMYEAWSACESTVGGYAAARQEWLALAEDERDAYIERHGDAAKAFARFQQNRVMREVATRDWHWLYTGEAPKVTFESRELEREIKQNRAHELATAERLAKHGIRTHFVVDHRTETDPLTNQEISIGLADMAEGVELKGLLNAKGIGAIDRALRDAAHKENLSICVIDNAWRKLDDGEAQTEIEYRMPKRGVAECLFLRSDGSMLRTKMRPKGTVKAQSGRNESIAHATRSTEERQSPKPESEDRLLGGLPGTKVVNARMIFDNEPPQTPASEEECARVAGIIRSYGYPVFFGGEEADYVLSRKGEFAATVLEYGEDNKFIGCNVYFRKNPTVSDLNEELAHVEQARRGDYMEATYGIVETLTRREIDAQNYLIRSANELKIPDSETKQTVKALDYYEGKLERLLNGQV